MRLTLKELIELFRTDPYSSFLRLRHDVRVKNGRLLTRIEREHGHIQLREVRTRTLLAWHGEWLDGDKVAIAHALISQLRVMFGFGAVFLEDRECHRLHNTLRTMRFEKPSRRDRTMTREQAVAHRVEAHRRSWDYMALAQALQFELMLGQRDVIGEWVPLSEPDSSDVVIPKGKWINGLRWEEIDQNLILHHASGKRRKKIHADLKLAQMVLEELALLTRTPIKKLNRDVLPATGPVILCEVTGWPYLTAEFRRKWRIVAREAGIPDDLTNSDSRPRMMGGGTDRGRNLQAVNHDA